MASTRDIKRRIKSINNTRQITKAMQMVSAAKMKKAQVAALRTRYYANTALEVLGSISENMQKGAHPLLNKRDVKKILLIIISPDKGLCGGLNSNLFKKVLKFLDKAKKENKELDFICVGKKGIDFAKKIGNIIAEYEKIGDKIKITDATSIAQIPINNFTNSKYDQVNIIFTEYVSTLKQEAREQQILPFEKDKLIDLTKAGKKEEEKIEEKILNKSKADYLFEPSARQILATLLPRLVDMQVYQAIVESNASEHSARMVAMQNASENAKDMIADLSFTYNQARQANITRELSEITAGAEALKK
ncbi:MAG: ATP synthase F1 subunit gamma [Patescibacteria group bacterium]|jgi:F-type H+-transporting ATPase subunit gamma